MAKLPQPQVRQIARERGVVILLRADEIDVFQPSLAVNRQVLPVLAEEPGPFPEEKVGDEREDDNRDNRVAAEEHADAIIETQPEKPDAALVDQ